MRRTTTMGLLLGMAIGAGSAGAAEARGLAQQGGEQQPGMRAQGASRSDQAARHFAVAHAGLETAEVNAEMLYAITRRPELYDRAHGELFVQNIREAIGEARAHVEHLEPLVQTDRERERLQRLRERIAGAQQAAARLQPNLDDVEKLHAQARTLDDELDRTSDPLERLAASMQVRIDVG